MSELLSGYLVKKSFKKKLKKFYFFKNCFSYNNGVKLKSEATFAFKKCFYFTFCIVFISYIILGDPYDSASTFWHFLYFIFFLRI